jgi:hypothetical protein
MISSIRLAISLKFIVQGFSVWAWFSVFLLAKVAGVISFGSFRLCFCHLGVCDIHVMVRNKIVSVLPGQFRIPLNRFRDRMLGRLVSLAKLLLAQPASSGARRNSHQEFKAMKLRGYITMRAGPVRAHSIKHKWPTGAFWQAHSFSCQA